MKIQSLELATGDLNRMQSFYAEVLNLPILDTTATKFSVQCGRSTLSFSESDTAVPGHFAFNIPFSLVDAAREWLEKRVSIIEYNGQKVIPFPNWKAKAIYFYDPDHNIVEFIGRQEIVDTTAESFTEDHILAISEVGLATKDIKSVHDALNAIKPISIYDGSYQSFCALGDPEGLFIVVSYKRKKWFPSDDIILPADLVVRGEYSLRYQNEKVCHLRP